MISIRVLININLLFGLPSSPKELPDHKLREPGGTGRKSRQLCPAGPFAGFSPGSLSRGVLRPPLGLLVSLIDRCSPRSFILPWGPPLDTTQHRRRRHLPRSHPTRGGTWPHGSRPPPGPRSGSPGPRAPSRLALPHPTRPTDPGRGHSGHPCAERPAAHPKPPDRAAAHRPPPAGRPARGVCCPRPSRPRGTGREPETSWRLRGAGGRSTGAGQRSGRTAEPRGSPRPGNAPQPRPVAAVPPRGGRADSAPAAILAVGDWAMAAEFWEFGWGRGLTHNAPFRPPLSPGRRSRPAEEWELGADGGPWSRAWLRREFGSD